MTDREIITLAEVLTEDYSFDPPVRYGCGAIEFKHVSIEFWKNGKILVKHSMIPGQDVKDLLAVMVDIRLIRQIAVEKILKKFYKRLEIETNV